jgi:hypothetical protein
MVFIVTLSFNVQDFIDLFTLLDDGSFGIIYNHSHGGRSCEHIVGRYCLHCHNCAGYNALRYSGVVNYE